MTAEPTTKPPRSDGDVAPPPPDLPETGDAPVRPGDVVTVEVTYGAPHHLVADGPLLAHRRTRAGALFEERGHEAGMRPGGAPTKLGLPGFGAPAPQPAVAGCAAVPGGGTG